MKTLFINTTLLVIALINLAYSGESIIPLKKDARLPSNDLIFQDRVLSINEAIHLKNVDLSTLSPQLNEVYDGENHLLDSSDDLNVSDGDEFTFEGALLSNTGLFRFNAISKSDELIYTVHLDKTLHTMLLRKNLLRRLGYIIPPMKYLKKLVINFESEEDKNNFVKRQIPENTLGAASRWIVKEDKQSITLKDIAVTSPSESDFYNLAMGLPGGTILSRTVRGILPVYSLLDLSESVNQFSWAVGKIDNNAIVLPHFTNSEFNSSIDDVLWMQRKISKLSRTDFEEIVRGAKFPQGIDKLIVEKLISRRNILNQLLEIKTEKVEFNQKISILPNVKEGRVVELEFADFASRFSYGDVETPLDQIRFYLYSKLQTNIIDNGIKYLNQNLEAFDLNAKRTEYFKEQFDRGLRHFVETGELLPIKIGTWTSPILNFKMILSRDIVIGNYLGADNLVQLADTFGAGIDLGFMVGVEGLPMGVGGGVKASTSLVRTFSHLKPVKSLKTSLKEPYRNLFVPLLKKTLKDQYLSLSELKNSTASTAERAIQITELFKEMDQKLGVGESLILTDRFIPTAGVDLNYSQGVFGAGIGISGSVAVVKRIHFYKKAPQVLQIFDDKGHIRTVDLSFHLSAVGIPFLKLNQAYDKGNYNIKSYMVNLNSNVEENPSLFKNALGVYEVLKNKNFEILSEESKPVQLNARFKDKRSGLSFLLWKVKKVKGQTYYDVTAKDGVNGQFYSYQKDFLTGANIESMSKKLVNYYIEENVDPNVSITDEEDRNPGETFYGKSHTETFRFEAAVGAGGKLEKKFLTQADVRQGWTMTEKKLKKFIQNINLKFNTNLFIEEQIDFTKLKLYKIGYHLNIYESGIERLERVTRAEINPIEERYRKEKKCSPNDRNYRTSLCGDLTWLKIKIDKCKENKLEENEKAICVTELFEKMLEELKFADFKKLIGEDQFYLYGTVDGFRKRSENLNDTIYSNSIGKIGSAYWNGPMEVVRGMVGISDGEFAGGWIREGL